MEQRVGQQLGSYRLIQLLGHGGFAHVYLGEHIYLKTRAAIKVLRVQLSGEHEQDFLKEAQTLAHLEHPHIVRVLDFGVQEGTPFLVMQYAPKGSLRRTHPKGTILLITTILLHLKAVASALHYAHERKVIHRDVKPENMLVGQRQHILLSDFGLAVVSHSTPQQQNVAGTVSYMAPEQLQGYPCSASDQYALGIVVYEWLCGVLPFTGSSLEVATQHLMAAPPPLHKHNSALSSDVERVVLTALAKKPDQRFADIMAFATAFEQAIQSDTPAHQLSDPSRHPSVSSLPSARSQQHPLVGRTQEWDHLFGLLCEAEQQRQPSEVLPSLRAPFTMPTRTPAAFIFGDAGIGKTRLAEELGREAQQRGWVVVQTRSYAQESHIPYRIWIDVLRCVVTQGLWQSQEKCLPPHLSQALAALLPEFTGILSHEEHPVPLSSKVEPFWIWEVVFALLTAVCKKKPLLLLLDDLHWTDTSSAELLGYLVRRLADSPVLLVGTCRESDVPVGHALHRMLLELQRERLMVQLFLPPLTDVQIGMLVAHVPRPLIASIQQQAAGNPFYAEELARACLAQRNGTGSVSISPSTSRHFPLPQTITGVLDQYLDKLSSRCQQFLRCAAVWEGSCSISTLYLMHARRNDTEGEEEMLPLLEEALEAKILLEEGSGNNIMYHFRHPLLQNRLYETVSATRRAMLHRQAAEVLQSMYATRQEEGAALIIHHLVQGGADPHVIADYAERAANHAYMLAAYPEAERYYRLAIEQEKGKHQTRIKQPQYEQAALVGECSDLASLLEQLGECLRIQGRYEEARCCYEQVLEIRSQCATTLDIQKERQLLAMLCVKIGEIRYDANDLVQAQQCYELGEQVLQDAGIVSGTAKAHLRLEQSYSFWHQGSYERAFLLAQEALFLFEQALQQPCAEGVRNVPATQIQRTLAGDPVDLGRTHVLLGIILIGCGRYSESHNHHHRALTIFEEYHRQRETAISCCNLGDLYLKRAHYPQAQSMLQRSLSIAEHMGEVPLMACVLLNLGLLQARKGNLAEAETALRRGVIQIEQLYDPPIATLLYACLATTLQEQGEVDEARTVLCGALKISREAHMAPIIGVTLIALGQLRMEQAIGVSDTLSAAHVRLLLRAKNTLQRALAITELEAETRVEGQLALAQVMFLEGTIEAANRQALHALEMARQLELLWLIPHAHCLLGTISAALSQDEQADQYFTRARQGFRTRGMRLAYGRTLQQYGHFLRRRDMPDDKADRQGWLYLLKAREIFRECNARRDLQRLELSLENPADTSSRELAIGKRS